MSHRIYVRELEATSEVLLMEVAGDPVAMVAGLRLMKKKAGRKAFKYHSVRVESDEA